MAVASRGKSHVLKKKIPPHSVTAPVSHPDHSQVLGRLRRAQGQLAGIEKMILERRYCVDILVQFRAAVAALKGAEAAVLERHVRGCVRSAVASRDAKASEDKVNELVELLLRLQN
ncbi:MAG TPA: metal-sensitive transcriptional regulator [Bdellovibrionota bacterium]|nr:metal-sensitive transcriptional regulator [Bdellovibrionota bacterium]